MQGALAFVDNYIRHGQKPGTILAINPEKVYTLRDSPILKEFFENAALLIPDGIGMVKALKLLHNVKVNRVPGADLMQEICAKAPKKGYRIFLYGAKEDVNRKAASKIKERFPGIQIAGRAHGYVKPEEMNELIMRINEAKADILFVGLGSPSQEQWMQKYMPRLNVKLLQGIGGTLDTITGKVKRAPIGFQKLGLEWFYRLLKQPTRFKRQLNLVRFVVEVMTCYMQKKREKYES